MSGEKLSEAINLLAEYAAANLPAGYEVVLVLRSDECWLKLQHDEDGDIGHTLRLGQAGEVEGPR